MKAELRDHILRILDTHRIMTVATNRADGWPQATVVGYVNDGLTLYCIVGRTGQKFTNIARDPRVSIAIANDFPDPLAIDGVSMAARAHVVEDHTEYNRALTLMLARYPEYAKFPMPDMTIAPLMRFVPELVSVLDYTQGFGHTDLVTISQNDIDEAHRLAKVA